MKTNKILNVFIAAGLMILSGCGLQAHIQKTPGTELGEYKTYSWLPPEDNNKGKRSYKNFQESYLKASIAEQLKKKGLTEVQENADISIDYDVQVQKDSYTSSQSVYSRPYIGYRYNRFTGRVNQVYYPSRYLGNEYRQVPYRSGTITVNIVDNKTNEVSWQGWAETKVDRKRLSTGEMDDIIKAIFKKYKK